MRECKHLPKRGLSGFPEPDRELPRIASIFQIPGDTRMFCVHPFMNLEDGMESSNPCATRISNEKFTSS